MVELDQEYKNNLGNARFNTIQSNNNDVTIIDFYYNEEKVDEVSPKLYSNTNVWTGNDAGMISDVTYLPAGGNLYPYFKTHSFQNLQNNFKVSFSFNQNIKNMQKKIQ